MNLGPRQAEKRRLTDYGGIDIVAKSLIVLAQEGVGNDSFFIIRR
jgi:hypothetical protein